VGKLDYLGMDHFENVTQYQQFFVFSKETKKNLHRSIYHADLSKYAKFHKNSLQAHGNMQPQTCQFLQRNVCQGALAPGVHFFEKIGKFGVPYFHALATDSYETSHIY
jgi:hypothetical protein